MNSKEQGIVHTALENLQKIAHIETYNPAYQPNYGLGEWQPNQRNLLFNTRKAVKWRERKIRINCLTIS